MDYTALATHGLSSLFTAHDVALFAVRASVGTFFAISGYHKLFNRTRHAAMLETLRADHVPLVKVNEWFVPTVEFVGGVALALGFASVFMALLLGAICLVATCVDGVKRIRDWKPLDRFDWLDDLLYLPEVLLGVLLVITILLGPGAYSVDHLLM